MTYPLLPPIGVWRGGIGRNNNIKNMKYNPKIHKKLKRDAIPSLTSYGEQVGVYWVGTDGSEVLFEIHPTKADAIIKIYNS